MQIAKNTIVTIDYTLTDDTGTVLDSSQDGAFAYLHGASNIIPGLESALVGKVSGDEISVSIPPEEAYGVRDENKVQVAPRDMFPDGVEINKGMQFNGEGPDGQNYILTVTEVQGDNITVDANHPLAGVNLNFAVKIVEIRDATEEEINHGHVHG